MRRRPCVLDAAERRWRTGGEGERRVLGLLVSMTTRDQTGANTLHVCSACAGGHFEVVPRPHSFARPSFLDVPRSLVHVYRRARSYSLPGALPYSRHTSWSSHDAPLLRQFQPRATRPLSRFLVSLRSPLLTRPVYPPSQAHSLMEVLSILVIEQAMWGRTRR